MDNNLPTIFVSIASYRDENCPRTLRSLYDNAKFPQRVFVGICQQNKFSDNQCIPIGFPFKNNIRIIFKNYKEAKGPTWARYLCSTLYQNENFFLQIDSHSQFVEHWDEKCIQMIQDLENSPTIHNKNIILSHYPPSDINYEKNPSNTKITTMVECFFNKDGIISFKGAQWKPVGKLPKRNVFIAGGFMFTRGEWLKQVPYDPHLKYLFVGEEILTTIRSFTHGWDVYTPNKNIVYHFYTRPKDPKIWKDLNYDNSEVKEKVKIILRLESDMTKLKTKEIYNSLHHYNIGNKRSVEEFYNFIGVDIHAKKVGQPLIEFYTSPSYLLDSNNFIIGLFFLLLFSLLILKHNSIYSKNSNSSNKEL